MNNFNLTQIYSSPINQPTSSNSVSSAIELLFLFLTAMMLSFKEKSKIDDEKMEEIIQELQKIMKELKGLMSSKGGDLSNALDSLLSELNQTEKKFNGTKKDLLSQLKGIQNAISKVMDAVAQASDPKQGTLLLELSNLLKGQIEKDESQLEDSSKSFSNTCNELKDIMQKLIHSDSPCAANLYLVESLLSQFATPENSC